MATPCARQLFAYLVNPTRLSELAQYSTSSMPQCVNGLAPYKVTLQVNSGSSPYVGNVLIYVDGTYVATTYITGTLSYTLYLTPNTTHTITISTPDGNKITETQVVPQCA